MSLSLVLAAPSRAEERDVVDGLAAEDGLPEVDEEGAVPDDRCLPRVVGAQNED